MNSEKYKELLRGILFFILIMLYICIIPSETLSDVVIVANKNVAENSLSTEEIKKIFLGKKNKWRDNSPITIVVNKTAPVYLELLDKYVKRTPSQFQNNWKRLVFTGEGKYPRSFSDDEKIIDFVSSNDGAISYVDADKVNDKVKIIQPE